MGVEADTGVDDLDAERKRTGPRPDRHLPHAGVSSDIGQGLLHDAEGRRFHPGGKPAAGNVTVFEAHVDRGFSFVPIQKPEQRGQ